MKHKAWNCTAYPLCCPETAPKLDGSDFLLRSVVCCTRHVVVYKVPVLSPSQGVHLAPTVPWRNSNSHTPSAHHPGVCSQQMRALTKVITRSMSVFLSFHYLLRTELPVSPISSNNCPSLGAIKLWGNCGLLQSLHSWVRKHMVGSINGHGPGFSETCPPLIWAENVAPCSCWDLFRWKKKNLITDEFYLMYKMQ